MGSDCAPVCEHDAPFLGCGLLQELLGFGMSFLGGDMDPVDELGDVRVVVFVDVAEVVLEGGEDEDAR